MTSLQQELQELTLQHDFPSNFWQRENIISTIAKIEQGSGYLASLCKKHAPDLPEIFSSSPDNYYHTILQELQDSSNIHQNLRIAKRKLALFLGVQSLQNNISTLDECYYLSKFADLAVSLALQNLWPNFIKRAKITNMDETKITGFFILGLGKLGGFELNYSSDIDLIALFDPNIFETSDRDALQEQAIRLCKKLSHMLENFDKDGYVFRVDFRLRPDPASTPLVMSVGAAETYYQYHGQNWERCALIKARVIAGDDEIGTQFLDYLRPFLWRKNLDYAALREIHSIKKRIYDHQGSAKIHDLEGHNIKLGRGGIREIEFFAQAWQLIWGGRDTEIRIKPTCQVLQKLAELEYIPEQTYKDLEECYWFLRFVEHRLQMMEDQQTHHLPESTEELLILAHFCSFANLDDFYYKLRNILQLVEHHYANLFEQQSSSEEATILNFLAQDPDEESLAWLRNAGYNDPQAVDGIIRKWFSGRYPAFRSPYGRELIIELTPQILQLLATSHNPQEMLIKCDQFFSKITRGVQFLTILHTNASTLSLFIRLLTGAQSISDKLITFPHLLEALVAGEISQIFPDLEQMQQELQSRLHSYESNQELILQDYLDIASRWAQEWRFILTIKSIYTELPVTQSSKYFSHIAQSVVAFLLPHIHQDFAKQYGYIAHSHFAIVALGKLGSAEMTSSSDLDLIFVYDADDTHAHSDGKKPLSLSEYYTKLCKRILSTINAYTKFGPLYEVDMRLRPSGNQGPLAISFERFSEYQRQSAWTWEHMALTKARPIAGDAALSLRLEQEIHEILRMARNQEKLRIDIKEMRQRIHQEKPAHHNFDMKYQPSGLVDLEFMIEYQLLYHAHEHAEILKQNSLQSLQALHMHKIISQQDFDILNQHYRLVQILQFYQRHIHKNLAFETLFHDPSYQDIGSAILTQSGHPSFSQLQSALQEQTAMVQDIYNCWINQKSSLS